MRMVQAWGMTETSPLAALARAPAGAEGDEHWAHRADGRAGRCRGSTCGSSTRTARRSPWDGEATGEIEVRGPWVPPTTSRTRPAPRSSTRLAADRRYRAVDEHGYMQITDRQGRDQVRRRVDLLGRARERADGAPGRDRGRGDREPRRTLGGAAAVLRGPARGREPTRRTCASSCAARVAKWWLPDEFAFVEEIPKTSVGKFDKKVLCAAPLGRGALGTRRPAEPAREVKKPAGQPCRLRPAAIRAALRRRQRSPTISH